MRIAILCFLLLPLTSPAAADEPRGAVVKGGESFDLFRQWPRAKQAPRTDLTIELWLQPDEAAVKRARNLVVFLTNTGGSDAAGLGMSLNAGVLHVNCFGAYLNSPKPLSADRWTHVAVTIDTQTINKQARLWIDGKQVGETLVLTPWPKSFARFQLLGDPWTGNRLFTGKLGDLRISRRIRYREAFQPATALRKDAETLVHLNAGREPS